MKIKTLLWGLGLAMASVSVQAMSLQEAYQHALGYNAEMDVVKAQEEVNKALIEQAQSAYRPSVNMTLQTGYENYDSSIRNERNESDTHYYSLEVQQGVLDFKREPKQRSAELSFKQAELTTDQTQQSVALTTIERYFAVLSALEQAKALDASMQFYAKKQAQVEQFYAKGFASEVDLLKAQAELDTLKAQVVLANTQILTAKSAFKSWVGQDWTDVQLSYQTRSAETVLALNEPLSFWENQIEQNSQLRIAENSVKKADVQLTLAKAERYPRLDLAVGYSDTGNISELSTIEQSYARLTLSGTLYQGGYYSARESESLWQKKTEQARQRALRQQVSFQLNDYWSQWVSAFEQYKSVQSKVASSQRYFEFVELAHEKGIEDLVELFNAAEKNTQAQLESIQAYYDALQAHFQLKAHVGQLTDL